MESCILKNENQSRKNWCQTKLHAVVPCLGHRDSHEYVRYHGIVLKKKMTQKSGSTLNSSTLTFKCGWLSFILPRKGLKLHAGHFGPKAGLF